MSDYSIQQEAVAQQYDRPWAPGYRGEMRYDQVTGTVYLWNQTSNRWIPIGSNDRPFTLYVDGVGGNDANAGDVANPVQTVQEAIDRLPPQVRHDATIDIQDNAGAVLTYDEIVTLEGFELLDGASIEIEGKTAPATLATGPNGIAPNVGHVGDFRSMTPAPAPGWTPGDLVGRLVHFTAGPHAGRYAVILANTANTVTFGARADAGDGAYGNPADAFDILDYTVIIENLSDVLTTLVVGNINARGSSGSQVDFRYLRIEGDWLVDFALEMGAEAQYVRFYRSMVAGYVYGVSGATGGELKFWESGIITNGWRQFAATPDWNGYVGLDYTGLLGSMNVCPGAAGSGFSFIGNCVMLPDPGLSDYAILHFSRGKLDLRSTWIDGQLSYIPILLAPDARGVIDARYGNIIENSSESGIQGYASGLVSHTREGSGRVTLLLEKYASLPAGEFVNDIRGNTDFGIDLTGYHGLKTYGPSISSVANGLGGCRCRWGGSIEECATPGNAPTIAGPLAPVDEIDFDDRAPSWFLFWTDDATGLETLCQIRT